MQHTDNDKAPITGKWSHWYVAVIAFLLLLIFLFQLFTRKFS
jgi:hypothetical protein